ncbi:MAG: hypothetical protein QM796_16915 [Chthoniobacteraceae bacterium]
MSSTLKDLLARFDELGSQPDILHCPSGKVVEVLFTQPMSALMARSLWKEYLPIGERENVTFFECSLWEDGMGRPGGEMKAELWLVMGTGVEIQMELVKKLGPSRNPFSGSSIVMEVRKKLGLALPDFSTMNRDRLAVLEQIGRHCEFLVRVITPAEVIIHCPGKMEAKTLQCFFRGIVDFQTKYGSLEWSEKRLEKEILKSGSIIL